jgi:hypothetical protein
MPRAAPRHQAGSRSAAATGLVPAFGFRKLRAAQGTSRRSLAGRALYLTLHPFTRRELEGRLAPTPFIRRAFDAGEPPRQAVALRGVGARAIVAGGFPPVCLGQTRAPTLLFRGYEQTYLRDRVGARMHGD